MNWDAIGAIGELVGAAAVVITLLYVAAQIRVAKSVAVDANRLNRSNGVIQATLELIRNEELRETTSIAWGTENYYDEFGQRFGISTKEATRLDYFHQYWFWLHWGQYSSNNSDEDLEELRNLVANFYTNPAIRHSWDHSPWAKPTLDKSFVEFVDSVLAKGDPPTNQSVETDV